MASLEDIKDVLSSINNSMKDQGVVLNKILNIQTKIQKSSEPKPDTSVLPDVTETPAVVSSLSKIAGEKVGEEILSGMQGILAIPANLLAASAALGLAFAGMRGWEVKIIDNIQKGIGTFSDSLIKGIKSIKTSMFLSFGLDVDGKPLPNSALDDLLKTATIKKFTAGLSKILTPIKMMGDFLEGLFSGAGGDTASRKAVEFLGKMGGGIGAFAATVGKILKPIGFLFSAYDGVMAFMNTEGSFMDKFIAGIGGFLGDFVGAPLDLLKNIVSWGISKLGFENAAAILDSFSFETLINDLVNGAYNMVSNIVSYIGELFGGALDWLKGYFSEGFSLIDIVFMPLSALFDFVADLFNWREEDAPPFNLRKTIEEWSIGAITWVAEKLDEMGDSLYAGFEDIVNYIASIPDRVKFAAEEMFIDVAARVEKGFILFGDWISSIPARIKAMALSVLNSISVTNPITGTVYKLVSDEDVAAAEKAVNEKSTATSEKLEELEKRTAVKKADLMVRMEKSGLYESVADAVAESPIAQADAERIRLEKEDAAVREFQVKNTLIEKQAQAAGSTIAVDAKQVDARTVTNIGGSSTTTIIAPRSISDLDYGLPRGAQ